MSLLRTPLHEHTGHRVDPKTAVIARELDMGEQLRRLTFALSAARVGTTVAPPRLPR